MLAIFSCMWENQGHCQAVVSWHRVMSCQPRYLVPLRFISDFQLACNLFLYSLWGPDHFLCLPPYLPIYLYPHRQLWLNPSNNNSMSAKWVV